MQQRRDTGPGLGILDLKGNSSSTPATPQRTNSRPLGDEPPQSNSAGTRPPSRSENDTANRINQPGGYPISTGPQVQPYGGASSQPYYPAIRFVDQSGGPQGGQSRPMIPTSVMAPRVQPPQKPTAKTSTKSESNGTSRAPSRTRSDPVPSPSTSVHPSPVETRRDLLPRQGPNPPLNFQYEHGPPVPSPSTSMRSSPVEPRQNSTRQNVPNTPLNFQYDLPLFRHPQSQAQLAPAPQRRHNGDPSAPPEIPSAQRRQSDQSMASASSTTPSSAVGPSPTLTSPFSALGPATAPPFIRDLAASALGAIQSKFEDAWTANVGAFQGELTKMYKDLERAQETISRLRKERDDARDTAHSIAMENERLMVQLDHAQRTKGPGPPRYEPQVRVKEEQRSTHPSPFDVRKPLTPAEDSKPTAFSAPTMIRFSSPSVATIEDPAGRRRAKSPILPRSMEQPKHARRSSSDMDTKDLDNKGAASPATYLPRFSQLDLPAIKAHSPAPERAPFKNNQPLPSPHQGGPFQFKSQPPHPPNNNHALPQLQPPSQLSPHDRPRSSNQMSRPGTSNQISAQYRTDTSSPIAPPFKSAPPLPPSYHPLSQQSPAPERERERDREHGPPSKSHLPPPPNQTSPHHPGTNQPPNHSSPPQHQIRPHAGPSNQHQSRTPMMQQHQRRPSGSDHASPPHQAPQMSPPQQHQSRTHMPPQPQPPLPPPPTQTSPTNQMPQVVPFRPFKRSRTAYESDHAAEVPTSSPPDAKVTKTAHQTAPREPSVKPEPPEPQANGSGDSDKEQRPPDPEPGPSAPAPAPPPPPPPQGRAPFKASSSSNAAPPPTKKKLGIKHLDLLYETRDDQMICRMCMNSTQTPRPPPRRFPLSAPWADLHRHYEETHPAECQDMEKLSSDSLAEMSVRQRMGVGKGGVKGHSKS
ncbi:uncharacterized protein EV420DRAFT_552789 [Desarmillaria tabescens]|uniref:Uncharacterized protein n=1 Tax=Armillaria tabescens TaxID=1929756 RepID=A0AA39N339_ARMTA|nr:uncharacterized protein EV420DRAFT_552789 [Desarmillaria tabescens]KAK0455614.1 hypothetical protein EV420DRAFT_552789 [Desarmillaria tabescens]